MLGVQQHARRRRTARDRRRCRARPDSARCRRPRRMRWRSPRPTTTAGARAPCTSAPALAPPAGPASSSASSRASASRGCSADKVRGVSWRGSRISVVFPTYNERDSIRAAILDFAATDVVDEILVVNNNAAARHLGRGGRGRRAPARTAPSSRGARARQGYGFAIQRGLREADRRLHRRLRAGRDVPRPRHVQAARLRRRLRRRLRQSHRAHVHLARRQHGRAAALGQLGRGQDDGVPVQQHQPDRRRLHHAPGPPRRAGPAGSPSSRSAAAPSAPR